MNNVTEYQGNAPAQQQQGDHPFQSHRNLPGAANVGSVAIEGDRAIAEAQGQLVLAKRFPRDTTAAYAELMDACKLDALAKVAFYSVPRAGGSVTGPSIRLAEEIARVYGNFEYGHRELSRDHEKSEVEVYAWDKEKNNYSKRQITVYHVRDTKNGPQKLRDQKDIDDKIANVASKQVRSRILALMPKWMVEAAADECRKTLAGNQQESTGARVRKMLGAFSRFGITADHIETYLGHGLDETLPDEIADLTGVYNAMKEGTPASEFFKAAKDTNDQAGSLKESATSAKSQKSAPKADPPAKKDPPKQEKPAATAKPEPEPPANEPDPNEGKGDEKGPEPASKPAATNTKAATSKQESKPDTQPDDTQPDPAEPSGEGEGEDFF